MCALGVVKRGRGREGSEEAGSNLKVFDQKLKRHVFEDKCKLFIRHTNLKSENTSNTITIMLHNKKITE